MPLTAKTIPHVHCESKFICRIHISNLVSWSYHEKFLWTWSVHQWSREWLDVLLHCTFVVIGRECRQFVPCVVVCHESWSTWRLFAFCLLHCLHFPSFDDFRVSIELADAVGLYSLWLGLITTWAGGTTWGRW